MRRIAMTFALIAAGCSPAASPQSAQATPQQASIDACVAAAATQEALWQCKGTVANPCMDRPEGQTTMGLIECHSREGQAWQALLDAHLTRLRAEDTSRAAQLAAAVAAWWGAWREAECAYRASEAEGGSLAGVIAAGCHSDITADRAIALTWAERSAQQ